MIVIVWTNLSLKNAFWPINASSVALIVTLLAGTLLKNALEPIVVTLLGIVIESIANASSNAPTPIVTNSESSSSFSSNST